jgi:aldose 1-epimerase
VRPWGFADGREVRLWSLAGAGPLGPMEIRVAEYGATLQAMILPGRDGTLRDVVLGHDNLAAYLASDAYFGAVLGRHAGRLRNGRVALAGQWLDLPRNEGAHHLHGGPKGFDRQVWDGSAEAGALVFRRTSPEGEMGYPGTLRAEVRYALTPYGQLLIEMRAETDAPTLCSLAHHGYWNLSGTGTILGHLLQSPAAFLLATDPDLLPTGEVLSVAGTGCDFRPGKALGQDFDDVSLRPNADRSAGVGFDHTLVLGAAGADGLRPAARLSDAASGLGFSLRTTAPALQVYAGGDLGPGLPAKDGRRHLQAGGIALETQGFPCAPDFAHFPQGWLLPGEVYRHRMVYDFFHLPL